MKKKLGKGKEGEGCGQVKSEKSKKDLRGQQRQERRGHTSMGLLDSGDGRVMGGGGTEQLNCIN